MLNLRIESIAVTAVLLFGSLFARDASAHGFLTFVDDFFHPTTLTTSSESSVLDNLDDPTLPPAGYNLFTDAFNDSAAVVTQGSNSGLAASYTSVEGFTVGDPGTQGFPAISSATFKILSPLYFADGTGAAQRAAAGTFLQIYDRDFGVFAGASALPINGGPFINVNGNTASYAGFPVSLEDAHELEKDLYLGAGSTQTFGEYGFAFDTTVHFKNGTTLTTAPLVDVFALTDPSLGDFGDLAPQSQQDTATLALYSAAFSAAAVPEPSTLVLAVICVALCAAAALRARRGGQFMARCSS
jgi:hypothetical protein